MDINPFRLWVDYIRWAVIWFRDFSEKEPLKNFCQNTEPEKREMTCSRRYWKISLQEKMKTVKNTEK